jgi:hypothetical protein
MGRQVAEDEIVYGEDGRGRSQWQQEVFSGVEEFDVWQEPVETHPR